MKVINISIKRKDGKVECDTMFAETMPTEAEVIEFCKTHDCRAIFVHVGDFTAITVDEQETVIYDEQEEETADGKSEICDTVQSAENDTK